MPRRALALVTACIALVSVAVACGADPTATPFPTATPANERIAALKADSEARGLRFLSHDEIVAGARREGALTVVPGLDDSNFPGIEQAFERDFPFIDLDLVAVSGTQAGERFDLSLISGAGEADIVTAGGSTVVRYAQYDLLLPYDYIAMAEAGELAIDPGSIYETPAGQTPFFNSAIRIIAYNKDLIPPEVAETLNWESCHDPRWSRMVATDTSTNFDSLIGAWTEEEILDYARKIKDNGVVFVRGDTASMVRVLSGEFAMYCVTNFHGALRLLAADPTAPLGIALTDPLIVSTAEEEAIYAGAKHPHAALLWMEWLSRPEVQLDVIGKTDPGKSSYLIEGTASYELLQTYKGTVHVCGYQCGFEGLDIDAKIVVDAWGFPRVGVSP